MKGNGTNYNATSAGRVPNLKVNMARNVEFSTAILSTIGADLYRPCGKASYNIRARDFQAMWELRNRTLTCRNGSNQNLEALIEIQSFGPGQVKIGTASIAQVGIDATPNVSDFFKNDGTSHLNNVRTVLT